MVRSAATPRVSNHALRNAVLRGLYGNQDAAIFRGRSAPVIANPS